MSWSAKPSEKPLVPAPSTPVCSLILSSLTNRWESSSRFRLSSPLLLAGYAAAACTIVADMPWRSGSYTSPVTQSRCSNTANLRATATAALFFAFFPPRSHSRNPYRRKSVSGPNGPRIYCALPTSSRRTIVSPALLMPNCGWLSPESSCFGTNPDRVPHPDSSRIVPDLQG